MTPLTTTMGLLQSKPYNGQLAVAQFSIKRTLKTPGKVLAYKKVWLSLHLIHGGIKNVYQMTHELVKGNTGSQFLSFNSS